MNKHRLMVAQIIGRPLLPGEIVHHINGDQKDNRPKNLILFASHKDHMRFEWGYMIKPVWSGRKRIYGGNTQRKIMARNSIHWTPEKYDPDLYKKEMLDVGKL